MPQLEYVSDVTGSDEKAKGSDGRGNVSSRTDTRSYYISRDESESYSLVFDDANCSAGDFVVYWKNTNTQGKHLVIGAAGVNSENVGSFKIHIVTGTAAGGATVTPVCLNRAAPKSAAATALATADSDSTPMSGLTSEVEIDHVGVVAGGHEEFRLGDRLRLGQDQAIAIEMDVGVNSTHVWGVIFGFYEAVK